MGGIRTSIDMAATPAQVWRVLTRFEDYPAWNPLILRMTGRAEVGAALRFSIGMGGLRMPVDATVLVAEPERELRWRGPRSRRAGRLFTGEHFFVLEPLDGRTRLVHGEEFSGLVAPLLFAAMERRLTAAFVAMNEALERRVEDER